MKLALGTAQFGLDYGISNQGGRTPTDEVRNILSCAAERGISLLDTAPGYGNSEQVLGDCLPRDHGFSILTKIRPMRAAVVTEEHVTRMRRSFEESLKRLRQDRVFGLLIHHGGDLLAEGGDRIMQALLELQQAGLIAKIGASIYEAKELDALLGRFKLDIVQLPVNVFDQRLVRSGHLARLQERGVEIHARSVFLQGLLLMDPATLPVAMRRYAPLIEDFRTFAAGCGCLPAHAALRFVAALNEVGFVVVGVNSVAQLEQLVARTECAADAADMGRFAQDDEFLLNPSLWGNA